MRAILQYGWTIAVVAMIGVPTVPTAAQETPAAETVRFVTSDLGNEARYRVREQLAGLEFPNDAVGRTTNVSGMLAVRADGTVDPAVSEFTIDVGSIASDEERRDNYVRRRTLRAEEFPQVVLQPIELRGLAGSVPTEGSGTLELVAELTVMGVTRTTEWAVDVRYRPDGVAGTATTTFTFEEFEIQKPSVARVLSVADEITLEFDFALVRQMGDTR